MKKWWLLGIFILSFAVYLFYETDKSYAQNTQVQQSNALQFSVDTNVLQQSPQRIGLNLSHWTDWGPEQFSRNILTNPGFESKIDRIVVIVSQSDEQSFSDGKDLGEADNYWNGATFDIRSGPNAGITGTVTKSLRNGAGGYPQYFTDVTLPPLQERDVIILTKVDSTDPISKWWIPSDSTDKVKIETSETRPGSAGKQSLALIPDSNGAATVNYFVDQLAGDRGKFLNVQGNWKISFWARAEGTDDSLFVRFRRNNGTPSIFEQTIPLTQSWQEYSFDFQGTDPGNPALLSLTLSASGSSRVLLDDIFLGPVEPSDSFFRQEVIDTIKSFNPSVLREWQLQLGDMFDNRVSDIFARKPFHMRVSGGDSWEFSYSIYDFLDLCKKVGANPWLVIPTTLNDKELDTFGKVLAESANNNVFPTVYLEFGNENWNWLFRPAGLPYPDAFGPVANRAFEKIQQAAGDNINLEKIVGGQAVSTYNSMAFFNGVPTADILAIAPYFFYKIDTGTPDADAMKLLFQRDDGQAKEMYDTMKAQGKKLAFYEINLHTTQGTATRDERNRIVAGMVSGTALARNLIDGLILGADPIMVFTLSGLENNTWDIQDKVYLWGITYDLSFNQRKRPTGLALQMINQAISGDMYLIKPINPPTPTTDKITSVAFKAKNEWRAAITSENDKPQELSIQFPDDGLPISTNLQVLTSTTPFDTNETAENVKITKQTIDTSKRIINFTIPAYGFVVLSSGFTDISNTSTGNSEAPVPRVPLTPEPSPAPISEPSPAPISEPTPSPEPTPTPTPTPITPSPAEPQVPSAETTKKDLQLEYINKQKALILDFREKIVNLNSNDPNYQKEKETLRREYIQKQRELIRNYRLKIKEIRPTNQ